MGFVPLNMVFITRMVTQCGHNFIGRYLSAGEHIMLHIYSQLAVVVLQCRQPADYFPSRKSDQVMYHVCAFTPPTHPCSTLCASLPPDQCFKISMTSKFKQSLPDSLYTNHSFDYISYYSTPYPTFHTPMLFSHFQS